MMCLYFMVLGTILGWSARLGDEAIIFPIMMLFILPLDFFLRFGTQQTPAMLLKPYVLLPVKKIDIIDCFLFSSIFTSNNLIWLSLILPFVYICGCGAAGFLTAFAILLLLLLMVLVNSQWYLLIRTLVNRHIAWWIIPCVVYGGLFSPAIIDFEKGMDLLFDICYKHALTWYTASICALILFILIAINRFLQVRFATEEVSKQEKTTIKKAWKLSFLEGFGLVGEYLKLEIKSTIRNKTIKQICK